MPRSFVWSIALGLGLSIILFLIIDLQTTWWWYWNWLFAASVFAFLLYGLDKAQAKRGGGRIPNLTHHIMALIGGYPGALLGRIVFNHKSNFRNNLPYLIVLLVSIIISAAVIYWHFFGSTAQ